MIVLEIVLINYFKRMDKLEFYKFERLVIIRDVR